ncbi:penicillin acylase family protein [Chryseolinea soli]|uniref:Penicillin acylase family protein n=1 Tax=Chryseolinea soli TaxID=2321403 RepID=A0A385SIS2_9BACT|nr:penicillin acylase family protein [Chryseolinea soli]AYB29270.1 penicillin acylase family protein [Chryseolinea soli]
MKLMKRVLIGLVILVIVLVAGIYIYMRTTAPDYEGTLKVAGLRSEVEVLFDDYGVPHIYAQNEEDAYFALGYVHAQDRLFQMEMLRRAAAGRLAEILGPELLKVDKLFRTLSLNQFAKQHAQKFLSSDTSAFQRAALAYQKGINHYIKTGKTPLEFTLIGIPKTEFTPEDIYLAVGFMSFGFAEGLRIDPVLQKIRTELGDEYLKDFAVQNPADAVLIRNFAGQGKTRGRDSLISFLNESLEKIPVVMWQGSNGWAVSAEKSKSGFPILANDTHIGFGQPAVWYEAHIEYPGFRLYGHHLAGVPFGLLGNNDFCAWGLTMFENDDTDFFIETLNPQNANQVKFKDAWEDMEVRKEIIKVKGQPDEILEVKTTRHGPVFNSQLTENKTDDPVALWWLLLHEENEALQAVYRLNHAGTFADARKAASIFSAPGLNLMYADRDKNIAWWAVAKLPIRAKHVASKFFLDGSSGSDEYLGFYDFSKNPQAINPPWGYVYSANNQPDSVEGVLYPGYYYPKGRSGRIKALLEQQSTWEPADFKKINLDHVSIMHPDVAKEIAAVLKQSSNPAFEPLVNALNGWDGSHKTTDIAPSIYYNMLSQIYFLGMKDELGDTALRSILATSITKNSYGILILHDASAWWDNVDTKDKKETRQDIFAQAAQNTIALLTESSGVHPAGWTWGKIHTLKHNHPLGKVKLLDPLFSVGPFEVEGGMEVINNLHFYLDTTGYFPVTGGPALRKITDLANVGSGETVSPTGNSGNVMSPFYADQAGMFATGKFRQMLMDRKEIEARSKHKMVLKP